jgi:hypothetical protein
LDSVSGFKFTISHDTTMSANRTYNPPNASGYLALTANASGIPDTLASGTVIPWEIQLAASDETTALTTGTAKMTFRMPWAATLTSVRSSVTTAPTGSTLIVDINEGGTTILSTKLSIDASEKTSTSAATAAVISDSALADDAEITIDIDQVGSTVAGAGLKITLRGTRTI